MKVPLYNQNKEKIKEIVLPKEIFEVPLNEDLVHQVVLVQRSAQRQNTAKVKDRSEVSGGGRKPWRQKGTGRARAGSIRSPLWRGGGVTFGPTTERVYKKKIPKKMRRKALFMVLSEKAKRGLIYVLEDLSLKEIKTKIAKQILERFVKDESCLIVLPEVDRKIILSFRNIPKVETIQARDLNVLTLLSFKYLLILYPSIQVIKDTFLKNN